jgi:hypothetical protein
VQYRTRANLIRKDDPPQKKLIAHDLLQVINIALPG